MAIEDIIPLEILFPEKRNNELQKKFIAKGKKKKVDKEAMASPMMRIPRMDVRVARDLIDVGIKEIYELQGRSAESIWEEIKRKKPQTPDWTLPYLHMAVYFCEEKNPDPKKLHPQNWAN